MDEFSKSLIKKKMTEYNEQYENEPISEKNSFKKINSNYTTFRIIEVIIIIYVVCSILGLFLTVAELYINIQEHDKEKALELLKEEFESETSYSSQNMVISILADSELICENGITIPLANKYINKCIDGCSIGKAGIENNIFTKEIKTRYEIKDDYDELESENFLTEFEEKLVELEGYEEIEVVGEEGKVFLRNEKDEFFTYIIINGYNVTYGIAKENVET